jgi:LysR family transcriptional regulator, chromosome initiation inhibitor
MGFDRQQLETFAVVVALRHFGHAARSLNITRGAVSQRINALEESLGMPLLVRDGASPTPAGEALLRHIQVVRALETDTLNQIKPEGSERTRVAIAVKATLKKRPFSPTACS